MHQALFVVDAFLEGNHGLCTTDSFDVVDFKDDILCVVRIPRPYFTENSKLARYTQ